MMRVIFLVTALLLTVMPAYALGPANGGDGSGGGGSGGLTPGTNAFFANPENIVPSGTGNIWFVDGTAGSDSNDCKSPAKACLTINHALSLAGEATQDVIYVRASLGVYSEALTVTKDYITFICTSLNVDGGTASCGIAPPSGNAVTINATSVTFIGFVIQTADDSIPLSIVGSGPSGSYSAYILKSTIYSNDAVSKPLILCDGSTGGADDLHVVDSTLFDGYNALEVVNGCNSIDFERNTLIEIQNNEIIDDVTDISDGSYRILNNVFMDSLTTYIDLTASSDTTSTVFNNAFNPATGNLTLGNIKLQTGNTIGTNSPAGPIGSVISGPSQQATIISSHITNSAQTAFTASGAVNISDIVLQTNATGLATGTNFVITTNNATGSQTLCSTIITGLGADKTVSCANGASVTKLVPFQLASGSTLSVSCSTLACTGAGTITVIPQMTRAVPYASLTNAGL